jgi:hypothetical protein
MPDHGLTFAETFAEHLPSLKECLENGTIKARRGRGRTPCGFLELDLQDYVRDRRIKAVLVDKKRGKTGKIDYQLVDDADQAVATCEVKGPSRKKLLINPENNWFWGIVKDTAKQFYRSQIKSPATAVEHYVAVLIPGHLAEVQDLFEHTCLVPLRTIFPTAKFGDLIKRESAASGEPISILVWRVGSK